MGHIGAPLLIAAVFATLFAQHSPLTRVAALPVILVAAWELLLGVWLVVKGFKPSPITAGIDAPSTPPGKLFILDRAWLVSCRLFCGWMGSCPGAVPEPVGEPAVKDDSGEQCCFQP